MGNIWHWLNRIVIALIFLAVLVGVALQYGPLLKSNQARRQQIHEKRAKLQGLESRYRQLNGVIEALKTDPKTVERTAREVLGYARAGEMVVSFEEPRLR